MVAAEFRRCGQHPPRIPAQRQKGRESGPVKLVAMPDEVEGAAKIQTGRRDLDKTAAAEGLPQARREMQPSPRPFLDARLIAFGMLELEPDSQLRQVVPEGMIEGFARTRAGLAQDPRLFQKPGQ